MKISCEEFQKKLRSGIIKEYNFVRDCYICGSSPGESTLRYYFVKGNTGTEMTIHANCSKLMIRES